MKGYYAVFRNTPFRAIYNFVSHEWVTGDNDVIDATISNYVTGSDNNPIVFFPCEGTTVVVGERCVVEETVDYWLSLL